MSVHEDCEGAESYWIAACLHLIVCEREECPKCEYIRKQVEKNI
jgi:hypothetical protein